MGNQIRKHPDVEYPNDNPRNNQHDPSDSQCGLVAGQMKSAQHELRLVEEIMTLVAMLQGDVENVDLRHEWVRIVPLLDTEDGHGSLEPILPTEGQPRPHVSEAICPDRSATDQNKEILWMMKLLIEMLCSRLRDEIQEGVSMEGEMATARGWTT